jgi:hypothetical protein
MGKACAYPRFVLLGRLRRLTTKALLHALCHRLQTDCGQISRCAPDCHVLWGKPFLRGFARRRLWITAFDRIIYLIEIIRLSKSYLTVSDFFHRFSTVCRHVRGIGDKRHNPVLHRANIILIPSFLSS